jgi:SSS family solute:Na+ symporter
LWVSQLITLLIGFLAILIGSQMSNVLDLMLNSYAFMVSGLLIPVLAALFDRKATAQAAMAALLVGGLTSLGLGLSEISLPLGLDPIAYGLLASIIAYLIVRPFHSQAKPLIHA